MLYIKLRRHENVLGELSGIPDPRVTPANFFTKDWPGPIGFGLKKTVILRSLIQKCKDHDKNCRKNRTGCSYRR
jgi:hypothetical protein